ncbi:MAG: hypothetical protein M1436_04885 [Acidobacteria bacterium]|nr:hypothetical protein [Acidobacteriota bacterium]
MPQKPLDGIDIWPLLSGARTELTRDVYLYFDNWNLQCARLGNYKLHMARYNSMAYSPPPAGGRINLPLGHPELYDVVHDVDESYDIASEHPEIVRKIQERVEQLVQTFPDEVKKAWADTKARNVNSSAVGAVPRPRK